MSTAKTAKNNMSAKITCFTVIVYGLLLCIVRIARELIPASGTNATSFSDDMNLVPVGTLEFYLKDDRRRP